MNIHIDEWKGHKIRFVELSEDNWWAVAKDISGPLGYVNSNKMTRYLDPEEVSNFNWKKKQRTDTVPYFSDYKYKPIVSVISETGILEAIFNSEMPEAKEFKKWVKHVLVQLRKSSGLQGFQIFRMLDKDFQKEQMGKLRANITNPVRVDFIKANIVANKAVSTRYGHPKMLKKEQMTPNMLIDRQPILEDTVNLMAMVDKFSLNLSVSDTIYEKYSH